MVEGKCFVNWFRVLVDLERNGYGATATATALNVAKSTLLGWKNGSRPGYEEGDRLLQLWGLVTGNGREMVPMISRFDWRA